MIRLIATASLLSALILVLYLPSAYPPERFVSQVRVEHVLANDFLGADAAMQVLAGMMDLQARARHTAFVPTNAAASAPNAIDSAVARQMSEVNSRLFDNQYFRSIDALFALATYRLYVLAHGGHIFVLFSLVALLDGWMTRIVRSKEFVQHDPERFGVYICAAIMTVCGTVMALVLPFTVNPLALYLLPLGAGVFVSRAVANFHRRP